MKRKGFVEVTLNPDGSVSQSVPCNTWGIIGDATSGGWSTDTQMEYDENTRLWTVITSLTPNHFKFRANNDWTINYGGDGATEFGLAPSGSDIPVANESAYIVTLNLTNAGKYTYSLEETTIELSSAFMTLPWQLPGLVARGRVGIQGNIRGSRLQVHRLRLLRCWYRVQVL